MKISILGVGTRGDVQPAIALAKHLQQRGHDVTLLAGQNFAGLLASEGLKAAPSRGDVAAIMDSEMGRQWARIGNHPIKQFHALRRLIDDTADPLMQDAFDACQGADLIVSGFVTDVFAHTYAEVLQKPVVSIRLQPSMLPTRMGAATMNAPCPHRTSMVNYLFGKFFLEPGLWKLYGTPINRFRKNVLGLPPTGNRPMLEFWKRATVIHAYSPAVVPHPPEWPRHFHTVGYFFLDEKPWVVPDPLKAFLAAGAPPIAISFGSMPTDDAAGLTQLLLQGMAASGQRAILLSGWGGLGKTRLPPTVFALDFAPFHQLLPKVAGVVHHGGAGTTAAGLLAGCPSLVIPHLGDQPFWGRRVAQLGCGPGPLRRDHLTAAALGTALRALVTEPQYRQNAEILSQTLRAENGLNVATRLIESHF